MYSILLLALLIQACGGGAKLSGDLIDRIPAESVAVVTIDIGQLMKKAEYEKLKQTDAVKNASEQSPVLKKLAENPTESGIDLNQRMYGFVTLGASMDGPGFSAFMLAVSDVAKMEAVMADIPNMPAATDKEGYKMVAAPNEQIIAWSKDVLVIANTTPDAEDRLKTIFSGGGEGSIKSSLGFKKSMAVEHDVVFWGTSNPIAKKVKEAGDGANSALSMAGFEEDALEDNYVCFYADYEKGVAKFGSEYEFNKSIRNDIGGIFKDELKIDLAKYTPAEGLFLSFHLSLSAKGIKDALSKGGRGMMAKSFLSQQGVNLDEILKAFGGDFVMSAHGSPSDPEFMFTLSVDDKKAMEELLNSAMETQSIPLMKDGDTYMVKNEGEAPTEVVLTDKVLSLTSNKEWTAQTKDGGFSGSAKADVGEGSKGMVGMYMNFEEIRKHSPEGGAEGMPGLFSSAMKSKEVSEVVFYLKRDEGMAKLNMVNSDRNSLAIIIEQAMKAAEEQEAVY